MNRPYVICHIMMSIDGKVTGDFLFREEAENATEIYYEINRRYKADAFVCGRVTMEGSFTQKWYPDLTQYEPITEMTDYVPTTLSKFYAVAFDPKGKLGWKTNRIVDDDPGYGNAQIIEVLTKSVDPHYLAYLQDKNIAYIFAGESQIDVKLALSKLKTMFGIETLLLEGGSVINGTFQQADVIDELSLVVAPTIADKNSKPLFDNAVISDFSLNKIQLFDNDVLWLNYKK